MTPAKRASLRELIEKATPGPWEAVDTQAGLEVIDESGESVACIWVRGDDSGRPNAAFIAAASAALPELLDDCDRLERTVELQRAVIAENAADAQRLREWRQFRKPMDAQAVANPPSLKPR